MSIQPTGSSSSNSKYEKKKEGVKRDVFAELVQMQLEAISESQPSKPLESERVKAKSHPEFNFVRYILKENSLESTIVEGLDAKERIRYQTEANYLPILYVAIDKLERGEKLDSTSLREIAKITARMSAKVEWNSKDITDPLATLQALLGCEVLGVARMVVLPETVPVPKSRISPMTSQISEGSKLHQKIAASLEEAIQNAGTKKIASHFLDQLVDIPQYFSGNIPENKDRLDHLGWLILKLAKVTPQEGTSISLYHAGLRVLGASELLNQGYEVFVKR